ncbi:hypothetical protein G6F24_018660 [Rhizopus arrhizus]|nr:hypothetical protein G6F24_018660 [Rhizopus arrhizus]
MIVRSSVVLPAPLRPTMPMVFDGSKLALTSRRMRLPARSTLMADRFNMVQAPSTSLLICGLFKTSAGVPSAATLPAIQAATRVA